MDMMTMVATPKQEYVELASDEQIERTVRALAANGIQALVVEDAAAARQAVLDLLPEGAEVFSATSQTLEAIGVLPDIAESGRYDAIRPKLMKLDRNTQAREMRKLASSPDVVVGSVHAVTEQGQLLIASGSGSQLAPYTYGAGQVIWVVGTQKIVPDLAAGLQRIEEHSLPLEDARMRKLRGVGSRVGKILIVNGERPGRATVILVKEALGF
jgi:L-lactate utilization protein LutC